MSINVTFDSVEELRYFLHPKPEASPLEQLATYSGAATMDEVYGGNVAICEKLDKLFQMMFGSTADKIVLGRAMPMNFEINGIIVIEMFAKECPQWAEVAKKYRELLAQKTTLYRSIE